MLPPIAAEPIFHLGNFVVTNSLLNGWISVTVIVLAVLALSRKREIVPRGFQNFAEWLLETMLTFADQVTGDRKTTEKFFPLVATIFIFVLLNNWLGLIPGTGSIGIWEIHEGKTELIPLLRPASSDLNLTLAIAAFSVLMTHIFGIMAIGAFKHASKFINIAGIIHALKKGPMAILVAIIQFGVGLIELVGEVAKTLSLSLRLFGNVFAGEVLLTVMAGLLAYALPLPFIFLEILVGLIQAMVFSILVLAFASVASMDPHGEEN